MSKILNFLFFFQRKKIIIIAGQDREITKEAISQVLDGHFKVGKEILIFEFDSKSDIKKFKFLIKKSQLPILVVTRFGQYHPEKEFFAGPLDELALKN